MVQKSVVERVCNRREVDSSRQVASGGGQEGLQDVCDAAGLESGDDKNFKSSSSSAAAGWPTTKPCLSVS